MPKLEKWGGSSGYAVVESNNRTHRDERVPRRRQRRWRARVNVVYATMFDKDDEDEDVDEDVGEDNVRSRWWLGSGSDRAAVVVDNGRGGGGSGGSGGQSAPRRGCRRKEAVTRPQKRRGKRGGARCHSTNDEAPVARECNGEAEREQPRQTKNENRRQER